MHLQMQKTEQKVICSIKESSLFTITFADVINFNVIFWICYGSKIAMFRWFCSGLLTKLVSLLLYVLCAKCTAERRSGFM